MRATAAEGIGALYALIDQGGGREVTISRDSSSAIVARSRGAHATWQRKHASDVTVSSAIVLLAEREGVVPVGLYGTDENPIPLREDLCPTCGMLLLGDERLDGHAECREQE